MVTSSAQDFETISNYLAWDHHRLDGMLGGVTGLVDDGDLEEAARQFAEYEQALQRHIRVEEEILFPLFARRTGMSEGPTRVMISEHAVIREAIDMMRVALERGRGGDYYDGKELLDNTMPEHAVKEERILYPAIDGALSQAERSEMIARLRETI
jgi:hemerythrin-like domain-containing protein